MRLERDQLRTLLALGGLTLLFVVGLWLPQQLEHRALRQRVEAAQKQLGYDRSVVKDLPQLARDVKSLRQATHGAQKYVPQEGQQPALIQDLSAELNRQRVAEQGKEILPQPVIPGADYSTVPVALRFRGSFPAVYGFLQQIEALPRLIRVDRLEVVRDAAEPTAQLQARIELAAFFSPVETEAKQP